MPRPPILDLGLLLRSFARSLPLAIVIGLVVGLVVGLVASGSRPVYTVTTTVSVGTPSRAERDAATMEALAAGMSEFVTDDRARYFIEERTGEPVTLRGRQPTVEVATSKIPGVLEVVTRSNSGPLSATKMGALVVEAMNLRAVELREEFLAPVAEAAQEEIDSLNEQIAARRQLDSTADTSDLIRLIYEARTQTEELRTAYPTASIMAQDDGGGEPTWPKPLATGFIAGLVVTMLAAVALGLSRIRHGRRTDRIWARSVSHRHGSVIDVDVAPLSGLPPLTEATVSAVLSAGGTVVVLGEVAPVETPRAGGTGDYRLVVAAYDAPWWREVPATEVDLGVVVVDSGAAKGAAAEKGLASLAEVGVPTRVVLREPEPRT